MSVRSTISSQRARATAASAVVNPDTECNRDARIAVVEAAAARATETARQAAAAA
jgi:hypothetical protein